MKLSKIVLFILLCLTEGGRGVRAQVPSLSISLFGPAVAQISWPTNFAGWQLTSATNLAPPVNWQPVSDVPVPFGNALSVFSSITSGRRFFRLQQTGSGGGCVFQATPPVISSGGSSTLSWCPIAGTTYQLFPSPGTVTGSNYVVFPAATTVYTLIASNATGITPSFATVTVSSSNACPWNTVTAWDGTLSFSYSIIASSSDLAFNVNQQANLSFHLTPSQVSPISAEFIGYVAGTAQINDRMDDLTIPPPHTTTLIGSGAPQQDINQVNASKLTLDIDCTTGTYAFTITPEIDATYTDRNGSGNGLFIVGAVNVKHRALPSTVGALSFAGTLPARGPFWFGGGDFYDIGGLGTGMFLPDGSGVVNDTTAGNATVSWNFTPSL